MAYTDRSGWDKPTDPIEERKGGDNKMTCSPHQFEEYARYDGETWFRVGLNGGVKAPPVVARAVFCVQCNDPGTADELEAQRRIRHEELLKAISNDSDPYLWTLGF